MIASFCVGAVCSVGAVFLLGAMPAVAANKALPLGPVGDFIAQTQIDGTGIYFAHTTGRRGKTRHNTIVRFDTATGKSHKVFDWGRRAIGDFRVGGGRLIVGVDFNSKTKGVFSMAQDGSGRTLLAKARWRVVRNRREGYVSECGTALWPSSISPSGDIVVAADAVSCKSTWGQRKYLIFRADGTRQVVNDATILGQFSDYSGYPFETQLTANSLIVSYEGATVYDLATGAATSAWGSGVDRGILAEDGSLWLSVFGASESGTWTALLRAVPAFDAPTTLATGSATGSAKATRFLPIACGANVLVARGAISDWLFDGESDGERIYEQLDGALTFGKPVSLDLYRPDGSLLRSLPAVSMPQVTAAGCDASGATLVGIGKHGYMYSRVAF